jgi:hypothetical protein
VLERRCRDRPEPERLEGGSDTPEQHLAGQGVVGKCVAETLQPPGRDDLGVARLVQGAPKRSRGLRYTVMLAH